MGDKGGKKDKEKGKQLQILRHPSGSTKLSPPRSDGAFGRAVIPRTQEMRFRMSDEQVSPAQGAPGQGTPDGESKAAAVEHGA